MMEELQFSVHCCLLVFNLLTRFQVTERLCEQYSNYVT